MSKIKENVIEFVQICQRSQKDLKKYLYNVLSNQYDTVISYDGFLYAQGELPILLVAHMDTVHKDLPSEVYYDPESNILSSTQGIGGDDRCGIYMILNIIEKRKCSVLFTEEEEIGGVGADKFVEFLNARKDKFTGCDFNYNYILEFDRANENDAVFYNCANTEFEKEVTSEYFKTAIGSFTDISVIAPYLRVAAVNLSCGYYKAHTVNEYVVFSEMENNIQEAVKLIDRMPNKVFEYVESKFSAWTGSAYDDYDVIVMTIQWLDPYDGLQQRTTYGYSYDEMIGTFLIEHPDLRYSDIEVEISKY